MTRPMLIALAGAFTVTTSVAADVVYTVGRGIEVRAVGGAGLQVDSLFAPEPAGLWDAELGLTYIHPSGLPDSTVHVEQYSLLEGYEILFRGVAEALSTDPGGYAQGQTFLNGSFVYTGPPTECTIDVTASIIGADSYLLIGGDIFNFSMDQSWPGVYHATGFLNPGTSRIWMQAWASQPGAPSRSASTTFDVRMSLPAPGAPAAMLAALGLIARRRR